MISERWEIYKSVHDNANSHTFYAGAVAMINEIIPALKLLYDNPPPELISLYDEMNEFVGYKMYPPNQNKMNHERWLEIEYKNSPITKEEHEQGWHYCPEWDEMCIGPTMPEWQACLCDIRKKIDNENGR